MVKNVYPAHDEPIIKVKKIPLDKENASRVFDSGATPGVQHKKMPNT